MTTAVSSSMEESNVPWWLVLLEGIAAIILGALLITNTGRTTVVLIQLLGVYWLLKGIFSIIAIFIDSSQWGWKLLIGILGIVAGILVIGSPIWSTAIVTMTLVLVLGINGIIIGMVEIIQAFQGGGFGCRLARSTQRHSGHPFGCPPVERGSSTAIRTGHFFAHWRFGGHRCSLQDEVTVQLIRLHWFSWRGVGNFAIPLFFYPTAG